MKNIKKILLLILFSILSSVSYAKTFKIDFGSKIILPQAKKQISKIVTGMYRTAIIYKDGTASMFGNDFAGQSDIPSSAQGHIKNISMGWTHTIILKNDGTLTAFGDSSYGKTTIPSGLNGKIVTQVSSGNNNSLALTSDGATYAWGRDNARQTEIPTNAQTGVDKISCGGGHCLALKNGGVIVWGYNAMGQINVPLSLSGVMKIDGGGPDSENSLALTSSGNLYVWGDNTYGQDNVPSGIQGSVKNAYLGDKYVVAITSNNNVVVFGNTSDAGAYWLSQFNNSYSGKGISIGPHHNAILLNNGLPLIWGEDNFNQTTIPNNVKDLYQ